ncbi:recombinase family protein [Galbitalea soli]|uniref:Recombinase family protein n=1 Tax=Galbitalea soli TaxID=1268042 RepID=A0A7C9TQ19_9MICO|nr:recombinase family protein [Galbitalea soli]NEM90915.1 recombinase family protein [Galbitalea soli]NYJ31641.1 DNA invertase Pin-like site-specific DNA recombinase [Galbitalea soli]
MNLPETTPSSAFVAAPAPLRPARAIDERGVDENELSIINSVADRVATPGSRAVVYLRVSSKGQVNTDYDPEGISIPAQRISCQRKAEQLGLTVVAEYVEAGISGTEMSKRVAFQQMLERIRRDRDVDYVIVYKLSRFARNRTDDAIVMADLQKRGVTLVSATESIDATPVGQLMHGILAAFNEYRSREDGADIAYKMGQKAKSGGTLGRAPIGYLNTIERVEGREFRGIGVDQERAQFVKLAFELYASGKYTFQDIAEQLTDRGLTTRPTARRAGGPISDSKVHTLLRDRYYLGEVSYKGEWYEGRHPRLIENEIFERVQALMNSRGYAGERKRKHDHYLKGTLWCGRCRLEDKVNRRMIQMKIPRPNGITYEYFFCRGVQDHTCDTPYSANDRVEAAVQEHYKTITFRPEFVTAIRDRLKSTLEDQAGARHQLQEQIQEQITRLTVQEENLLDLAADPEIDTSRVRARLRDITRKRSALQDELTTVTDDISSGVEYIDAHVSLLEHPYELYQRASDEVRRELNQAIFEHIYVINDEVIGDELKSPLRELLAVERGWIAQSTESSDPSSVARAAWSDHGPAAEKATPKDGLIDEFVEALLSAPVEGVGSCSNTHMVPLEVSGFRT